MFNPTFLSVSRHRVWYFRWPLPRALHPLGRASDVKVSLQTRDPKEALRLARTFSHVAQAITDRGIDTGMRFEEIRAALKQHFVKALAQQKAKIAEKVRYRPDYAMTLRRKPKWVLDAKATGEKLEDWVPQCSGYCLALNQSFKNENPVQFFVLTNGLKTNV